MYMRSAVTIPDPIESPDGLMCTTGLSAVKSCREVEVSSGATDQAGALEGQQTSSGARGPPAGLSWPVVAVAVAQGRVRPTDVSLTGAPRSDPASWPMQGSAALRRLWASRERPSPAAKAEV